MTDYIFIHNDVTVHAQLTNLGKVSLFINAHPCGSAGIIMPSENAAELGKYLISANDKNYQKAKAIIDIVAAKTGIAKESILGKMRYRKMSRARHIAFYLIRKYTALSFPQISKIFKMTHASVIYANRILEQRIKIDANLAAIVKRIEGEIEQENNNGNVF